MPISLLMVAGGLAALVFGGRLFVNSAVEIAKIFNISEKFIAITVMAVGTSLPELATCIVAAFKGRGQLALGNILGSNISNIILILGGAALIHPLSFAGITTADISVLLVSAIMVFISFFTFVKKKLDRVEGAIFIILGIAYMAFLIYSL